MDVSNVIRGHSGGQPGSPLPLVRTASSRPQSIEAGCFGSLKRADAASEIDSIIPLDDSLLRQVSPAGQRPADETPSEKLFIGGIRGTCDVSPGITTGKSTSTAASGHS